MKELVAYWRDKFDWRKQERALNAFDRYTTTIDGLQIHFISTSGRRIPTRCRWSSRRGFPSSISEYMKVIGPLTDPVRYGGRASDAFQSSPSRCRGSGSASGRTCRLQPGKGRRKSSRR
jgi:hypothetical protein